MDSEQRYGHIALPGTYSMWQIALPYEPVGKVRQSDRKKRKDIEASEKDIIIQ